MLCVRHHGLEQACATMVAATCRSRGCAGGEQPLQQAHYLSGPLEPAAAELRGALTTLCWRLLDIVSGGSASVELAARGERLRGRLCLRAYAAADGRDGVVRLGAHIDHTLLTLLWADAPGLEVFAPAEPAAARATSWSAKQAGRFCNL